MTTDLIRCRNAIQSAFVRDSKNFVGHSITAVLQRVALIIAPLLRQITAVHGTEASSWCISASTIVDKEWKADFAHGRDALAARALDVLETVFETTVCRNNSNASDQLLLTNSAGKCCEERRGQSKYEWLPRYCSERSLDCPRVSDSRSFLSNHLFLSPETCESLRAPSNAYDVLAILEAYDAKDHAHAGLGHSGGAAIGLEAIRRGSDLQAEFEALLRVYGHPSIMHGYIWTVTNFFASVYPPINETAGAYMQRVFCKKMNGSSPTAKSQFLQCAHGVGHGLYLSGSVCRGGTPEWHAMCTGGYEMSRGPTQSVFNFF